jgi:hypothetical protein
MTAQAYPLSWPAGWGRVKSRSTGQFTAGGSGAAGRQRIELHHGVARVFDELERLKVKEDTVIISTNVRPSLGARQPATAPTDPGVAVYWTDKAGLSRCMATDRYTRVADNLAAIAATLEALRAIERHGGAEILDRAFMGFAALPAPEQAWAVLGVTRTATKTEIERAYRRLAMDAHPDRGGDQETMARLNAARDAALAGAP